MDSSPKAERVYTFFFFSLLKMLLHGYIYSSGSLNSTHPQFSRRGVEGS